MALEVDVMTVGVNDFVITENDQNILLHVRIEEVENLQDFFDIDGNSQYSVLPLKYFLFAKLNPARMILDDSSDEAETVAAESFVDSLLSFKENNFERRVLTDTTSCSSSDTMTLLSRHVDTFRSRNSSSSVPKKRTVSFHGSRSCFPTEFVVRVRHPGLNTWKLITTISVLSRLDNALDSNRSRNRSLSSVKSDDKYLIHHMRMLDLELASPLASPEESEDEGYYYYNEKNEIVSEDINVLRSGILILLFYL